VSRSLAAVVLGLVVAVGCRASPAPASTTAASGGAAAQASSAVLAPPTAPPAQVGGELVAALPAAAGGFVATAIEQGAGFVRRVYARGPARITVTLAELSGPSLERWIQMSTEAGYPEAMLGAPRDEAWGFYDCSGAREGERCDLHAHTRGRVHIEMESGGTATRADLDALAQGLAIRALAARPARDAGSPKARSGE
jgi:hypothetical protein